MEKETIRIVGRRQRRVHNLESMRGLLKLVVRLREGKPLIPKGVHRFTSFEESQEWSLRMMTRRKSREPQQ
jgi:hypothetical protein